MDLTACDVVNSTGVARVFEIVIRTREDFSGQVWCVGLNPLTRRVFQMAGVLPQVDECSQLADIPPAAG